MDIAADVSSSSEIRARRAGGQLISGVKDFGNDFMGQLFGTGRWNRAKSEEHIEKLDKADKQFSDEAYAQTRARIMNVYEEHRLKRLRENESNRLAEVQKLEAKNFEKLAHTRQQNQNVATAIAKGSAEVGKNWGSE